MNSIPAQQTDIFLNSEEQLAFAELCNALYERELKQLSQTLLSPERLKRKLGGLSYHVRGAAEKLMQSQSHLRLDTHNASWQAKQSAKCAAAKADIGRNIEWFTRYSRLGLVVGIYVIEFGVEHIELDSIDRIDMPGMRLHTNRFGWFEMQGNHCETSTAKQSSKTLILNRPGKSHLTAACCGHRWNYKGKTQPRALTIRELLLSTTINWQGYR